MWLRTHLSLFLFFFNDTATTEISTLSLHDALPISVAGCRCAPSEKRSLPTRRGTCRSSRDRKSTRLNSSHTDISYAVFCLQNKHQSVIILEPRQPPQRSGAEGARHLLS